MVNQLIRLFAADNSLISDVTLRAIGKACRELTILYIAGCCRVSDHGLKGLTSLKKLQVLNIADCNRFIYSFYTVKRKCIDAVNYNISAGFPMLELDL